MGKTHTYTIKIAAFHCSHAHLSLTESLGTRALITTNAVFLQCYPYASVKATRANVDPLSTSFSDALPAKAPRLCCNCNKNQNKSPLHPAYISPYTLAMLVRFRVAINESAQCSAVTHSPLDTLSSQQTRS